MGKSLKKRIRNLLRFFPLQLFFLQFQKDLKLLFFWVILFLVITNKFGSGIGLSYLFLDPAYLNELSFISMFILGVAFGIFTMSYFITTYILESKYYNFLGTIKYPFLHFCLNNSITPLLFCITYLVCFTRFQIDSGLSNAWDIIVQYLGFVSGVAIIISATLYYFRYTFKFFFKDLIINFDKKLRKRKVSRVNILQNLRKSRQSKYSTQSYLGLNFKVRKLDSISNYDVDRILKVFDQHHLNAISVEIIIFIFILIVGVFRDSPYFQIPAAASGLLFLSFFVMFSGAITYWMRRWTTVGIIGMIFLFNYVLKHEWIDTVYPAFGIDYKAEKVKYSLDTFDEIASVENFQMDYDNTIEILEKWRSKFDTASKPKMVFLCSSGGGQRSSTWTIRTLQHVDSLVGGDLMKHTILITGASGGMIGTCYYRDLYLQKQLGNIPNTYDQKYLANISKDMLNPMIFSLVVNDIFLRFKKFEYDGKVYKKGRGYAFEKQLYENTDGVFLDKVTDYGKYEKESIIPMTILSPVAINDARKLYVSAQPISYMTTIAPITEQKLAVRKQGTELSRLLKDQGAEDLKMLSAMRMGATFPYITPNIVLPTSPQIEIMDAGLSDNYGLEDATKFLYVFKGWIAKNTGGVIFLSIRDSEVNPGIAPPKPKTLVGKFITPVGSLYNVWDYLQDYRNMTAVERSTSWFDGPVDYVPFQYSPGIMSSKDERKAVLSWHLTKKEIESIKGEIYTDLNKEASAKMVQLLK